MQARPLCVTWQIHSLQITTSFTQSPFVSLGSVDGCSNTNHWSTLYHNVVKFLPKWCPGSNFQHEAEKCRKLLKTMVHDLYDEVVEKMVSRCLRSVFPFTSRCYAMQDNGTAPTSYVQGVLQEKGGTGKLSAEEVNTLKWSAGDLFGGSYWLLFLYRAARLTSASSAGSETTMATL